MKLDTIVLATRNPHKAAEMKALFADLPFTVRDLSEFPSCPDVEEDGDTLEDNAYKKAEAAYRCTGLPAVADDTGLEVYYMLGRPGVYSARYAGEDATYADNCKKLLHELTQVPARKRDARFRCVIALVGPGTEEYFEGRVEGRILLSPQGSSGFGYDPVFQAEGFTRSFAELTPEEKNAVSHRGNALRTLKEFLAK
jgi:XTP/dITP diphosphohydrolase